MYVYNRGAWPRGAAKFLKYRVEGGLISGARRKEERKVRGRKAAAYFAQDDTRGLGLRYVIGEIS